MDPVARFGTPSALSRAGKRTCLFLKWRIGNVAFGVLRIRGDVVREELVRS